MGLTESRARFRELLPDELKGAHVAAIPDAERERLIAIREGVLTAFEEAAPKPHPVVRVQTVDEYVGPGQYRRTFEVVDTRLAGKARVVASVATREEAERRREKAYLIPVEGGKHVRPIGGASYTYAAVDADEYWHDTDVETIASLHTYGVISGCTVTADAANLTVDLAAGTILHSGSSVTVAGATDAYTLVADGSNERWAALTVSSAGAAALVSGDPAASASSEPVKPEIGDRVLVAFAKIQAAQTIAANVEYLLDKRAITHIPPDVVSGFGTSLSSYALLGMTDFGSLFGTINTDGQAFNALGLSVTLGSGGTMTANAALVGSKSGGVATLATNTSSGGKIFVSSQQAIAFPNKNPYMVINHYVAANNAALAHNIAGFTDNALATATDNGAYLRKLTTGNLYFVTRQGGAETTTDLGASTAALKKYEIYTTDAGVTWICKAAGVVVATHTTNVPTASTGLIVTAGVQNNTTTNINYDIDYLYAYQTR